MALELRARLRPVTPVLLDYLSVVAEGPPEAHGFERVSEKLYRCSEGWEAVRQHHQRSGRVTTVAELSGEDCHKRQHPMSRWTCPVKITRADVTRDVVGLPVSPALPYMFAGTRKARSGRPTSGWRESRKGETVYIGSPESPLMLRIYSKRDPGDYLAGLWHFGGVGEGEEVTRVEYQCRTKQAARSLHWQGVEEDWRGQVHALWDDCLARIRLCAALPSTFRQANEAPTHPAWELLASKDGPRKLAVPTLPPVPPSLEHVERVLTRFMERGGDGDAAAAVAAALARIYGAR